MSPTGYPMRMLKNSPACFSAVRPNCEAYGYLLEDGKCSYINAYERELKLQTDERKVFVRDKTCLCTYMRDDNLWTCGHYTYRLKDTTNKLSDGSYQKLSAEHIFRDYQYSKDQKVMLPKPYGASTKNP
jgi:nitronate monooxygenase